MHIYMVKNTKYDYCNFKNVMKKIQRRFNYQIGKLLSIQKKIRVQV